MPKAERLERDPSLPVETDILALIQANRALGRRLRRWSKLRAAGHANEGLAAVKLICHTPVPLER
jgi:hypothetical protein